MEPISVREDGPVTDAPLVTKVVVRAADRLKIPNKVLARVLGLSEAPFRDCAMETTYWRMAPKPSSWRSYSFGSIGVSTRSSEATTRWQACGF
jgi:hypothetical protein